MKMSSKRDHNPIFALRYILMVIGGLGLFLSLAAASPLVPPAQDETPTPTPTQPPQPATTAIPLEQQPEGTAEITFALLGYENFELHAPLSQRQLIFEMPYRWLATQGAGYIELHYDAHVNDANVDVNAVEGDDFGVIEAYFDGEFAGSFVPDPGTNQAVRLDLPPTAFADPTELQHVIDVVYLPGPYCYVDDNMSDRVVVRDSSYLHFNYSKQPINVNLHDFPRPLYQGLFSPETVLFVIPDNYEDTDLETAASLAATLGTSTFGGLDISVAQAGDVTPDILADTSVVAIGTPEANGFTADLYSRGVLPTTLLDDGTIQVTSSGQAAMPEDGVIQQIPSEVNGADYAYLVVTGATSEGVNRAALALSSLSSRLIGLQGNVTIISDVVPAEPAPASDVLTLTDLGLRREVLSGIGVSTTSVSFTVPSTWEFTSPVVLNLIYRHSAVLLPELSDLTIFLNDNQIGSVRLVDASTQSKQVALELPEEDLEAGRNELRFEATLEVEDPCAPPNLDAAWVRIMGDSTLNLEHIEGEATLDKLENPLTPLRMTSNLGDVWFVLPTEPVQRDLNGMIKIVSRLGEYVAGGGYVPRVSRGTVPEDAQDAYHFLAIGRPTLNPFIVEINDALYQPFVEGEDALRQEIGNVYYRLSSEYSLGLVQLIRSPWEPQHAIVVITGTTEEGVDLALAAVVEEAAYTNLTIVGPEQFEALNGEDQLRGSVASVESAVGEEVELETLTPEEAAPDATRSPEEIEAAQQQYVRNVAIPGWVLPVSAGAVAVGFVIIAVGALIRRRRR
jgi:hypothetical protein